jgi:hypothetical protein
MKDLLMPAHIIPRVQHLHTDKHATSVTEVIARQTGPVSQSHERLMQYLYFIMYESSISRHLRRY